MYVVTESIEFFSLLLILFFLRGAFLSFFLDLSIDLHFGNALLFKISAGSTVHDVSFWRQDTEPWPKAFRHDHRSCVYRLSGYLQTQLILFYLRGVGIVGANVVIVFALESV